MARSALDARATWVATQALGRVSVSLGGRAATRLWFTPWRMESESQRRRERAWLETTTPMRWSTSEGELEGFTAGAGPTVLLVHGWSERAAMLGALIDPLVARGYRVAGVDLPGHGNHPSPSSDIPRMTAAVREVARDLDDLHGVAAHSLGGVVTALALRDGVPARRAVLIAPAVRPRHALETFVRMFRVPRKAARGLEQELEKRFGATVWTDFSTDEVARSLDVPVMIVHDESDDQVAVADAELLASAWPDSKLVLTKDLGHMRILRDPDVVGQAVDFLTQPAP